MAKSDKKKYTPTRLEMLRYKLITRPLYGPNVSQPKTIKRPPKKDNTNG